MSMLPILKPFLSPERKGESRYAVLPPSIHCLNSWCIPVEARPLRAPLRMTSGVTAQPFSHTASKTPSMVTAVLMILFYTYFIK